MQGLPLFSNVTPVVSLGSFSSIGNTFINFVFEIKLV